MAHTPIGICRTPPARPNARSRRACLYVLVVSCFIGIDLYLVAVDRLNRSCVRSGRDFNPAGEGARLTLTAEPAGTTAGG